MYTPVVLKLSNSMDGVLRVTFESGKHDIQKDVIMVARILDLSISDILYLVFVKSVV